MVKQKKDKTSKGTNEQWVELCEYVKIEILGYSEDMKYPRNLALRLRGLSEGKFMANNYTRTNASYDYNTILLTFKANKFLIQNAIAGKEFNSESQKVNYIFAIIEDKIIEFVLRLRKVEKEVKKAQTIVIKERQKAEYQKKTKEVKSNILNNLW